MEDTIIQYDTAVLAKEKGFKQHYKVGVVCRIQNKINKDYEKVGELKQSDLDNEWTIFNEIYPSQSLLAKWLREVHNLHIDIRTNHVTKGKYFYLVMQNKEPYHTKIADNEYYDTYEQALEEGLYNALKLI